MPREWTSPSETIFGKGQLEQRHLEETILRK